MRWRTLPIGLAAALGAAALPQQPEPKPPESLAGRWTGSAKFQTEGGTPCRYEGGSDPPALVLELHSDGSGRIRLTLDPPAGTECAPIAVDSPLSDASLSASTAFFKDTQGREWNLALQAGVLRGLFSGSDGSGELTLQRRGSGERRAAAEKAAPSPSPSPTASPSPSPSPSPSTPAAAGGTGGAAGGAKGPGMKAGTLGFIGANIVALGALLGVTHATQDQSAGTSTLVCSPRVCLIGAPGEPCDCTSTITTGQDCGQTQTGIPIRGACALPDLPCQALLSCNNNICEDRLGSCPF